MDFSEVKWLTYLAACHYLGEHMFKSIIAGSSENYAANVQCMSKTDDPTKCRDFCDDYLECLHHRKEVSTCPSSGRASASEGNYMYWNVEVAIICFLQFLTKSYNSVTLFKLPG